LAKKICGGSDHTVYIIEKDDKNVEKISEDDIMRQSFQHL